MVQYIYTETVYPYRLGFVNSNSEPTFLTVTSKMFVGANALTLSTLFQTQHQVSATGFQQQKFVCL